MRHPTEGTLRRLLDDPAGVPDPDRDHVAACPACRDGLNAASADAALASRALAGPVPDVDVDRAWSRLHAALDEQNAPVTALPARRRRSALRSPLAAGLGVAVVVAGAGAAAAADWLQIFKTERVAPVTLTSDDVVDLPDLSSYGELDVLEEPDVHEVADAAAAADVTGLEVPQVDDLPQGVTGEPDLYVSGRVSAQFTFSEREAAQAAAAAGQALPPPPPGMDGGRFRLVAGPGLATVWSESRGVPALVVARAVAPTGESSGLPFDTARDYLLSLPGLPDDVAGQLRAFSGDGTTLPLPVPADEVTSSRTDVDGRPATVLRSRDGLLAGVVWVDDGVLTVVGGSLSPDELLAVARGLGGSS